MTHNDFTTVDRIIANAAINVNDGEFRNGFSKGWYKSHAQQALQDLSIESKWLKITKDFEVPSILQVTIPKGVFDIREIYLYNGAICNPADSQVVHWKRLFNNKYNGDGYTARVKDDGSNSGDPFIPNQRITTSNYRNYSGLKYYYNVDLEDGIIMLSKDCAAYANLRVIFNGMGGQIGDEPIIPRFFERAIIDFIEERFYNAMKARDVRKFRPLWMDAVQRLDDRSGAWKKAIKRVKEMDKAEKASLDEYISSMYHK